MSVAQKRDENGTAVYSALIRYTEFNQAAYDHKKREELLTLNKTTLEYLYIR